MTSLLLRLVEASVSMLSLIDHDREVVVSDEDEGSRVADGSRESEGGRGGSSELEGSFGSSELDDDGGESSSEEESEGGGGGGSEIDDSSDDSDTEASGISLGVGSGAEESEMV